MDSSIQISKINDFLYCPLSLYLHSIYADFDTRGYHDVPQIAGKIAHETIDSQRYSSAKRYMQGSAVFSDKYGLVGKIDVYDRKEKSLIERKNKIKHIYLGYKFQLYAEYFCMKEMGYPVKTLFLHSLSDNKRYAVPLPNKTEMAEFKKTLESMRAFGPGDLIGHHCANCQNNIYSTLAWI